MTFGEVVANLLKERGMSIAELARDSGVKETTIRELLKGRSKEPTVSRGMAIADALGISLQEIWEMMQHDD